MSGGWRKIAKLLSIFFAALEQEVYIISILVCRRFMFLTKFCRRRRYRSVVLQYEGLKDAGRMRVYGFYWLFGVLPESNASIHRILRFLLSQQYWFWFSKDSLPSQKWPFFFFPTVWEQKRYRYVRTYIFKGCVFRSQHLVSWCYRGCCNYCALTSYPSSNRFLTFLHFSYRFYTARIFIL